MVTHAVLPYSKKIVTVCLEELVSACSVNSETNVSEAEDFGEYEQKI